MTLTAPEHLRGKIGNHRPNLLAERNAWILTQRNNGHSTHDVAQALGIRANAVRVASANAGYVRQPVNRMGTLWKQGLKLGKLTDAFDGLPYAARVALADCAARSRKPMATVLADFWAQHHGERG